MSIATQLAALQQDITNARSTITSMGGTTTSGGGSSQLATDIATIPTSSPGSIVEVETAAEMDALLITANLNKVYKYIGISTASYINGNLYQVILGEAVREAVSGQQYTFVDSSISITGYDPNVYAGLSQSNNKGVNSSKAVCKLVIKGVKEFTLWINSYAESNYDYTIASTLDAASIPTLYSGSYTKDHTRGFQRDPRSGLNTSYWKKVIYTETDGLDGGEHFIYVVYTKDSSSHYSDDRGYFCYEKAPAFKRYVAPSGKLSITDTAEKDVSAYSKAQVVDAYLIPGNIKKDISILGVVGTYGGGGGSSGYKVHYYHKNDVGDGGKIRINDGEEITLTTEMPDASGLFSASAMLLGNVEKFKVWGFSHRGAPVGTSSSWARYRVHPSGAWTTINLTLDEASATEIVLSADIDLEIYEGTCLNKGTLITMYDGTKKSIEEIEVGDIVLGYDGEPNKVWRSQKGARQFCEDRDIWLFEDGYKVVTTYRHRFYNHEHQCMMYLNDWKIGEHAITEDGSKVALIEHTHEDIPCMHFSLWCENENYFAGGLLAGNRFTEAISIE